MAVDWNGPEFAARARAGAFVGVIRAIGLVDQEAMRLIMRTAKTGKVYRRRGVEHQASAPGEAPASDTGRLVASKTIEPDQTNLRALLVFRTDYARALELGTKNMEPRPYARPALLNMQNQILDAVSSEIVAALK